MLELEKEELQHALDGAESALEVEESKMLRIQSEVAQIRADIDRRIAEKEASCLFFVVLYMISVLKKTFCVMSIKREEG